MNQHTGPVVQRLTANLLRSLLTAIALLGTTNTAADSASDLHAQLKERWYTTELIVFRYTSPSAAESIRFEGERVTAEQYRKRLLEGPPEEAPEEVTAEAINVLTLGDTPEDVAAEQRPALDVEPGERILDYGEADDLGALVAANMATWEAQLRNRDGKRLEEEQLTLREQATKLAANRSTEVLLHTGWTQAVPARNNGSPIEVSGGETFSDPRNGDLLSRLEGEVTVTLGRYLHVQPTLFYTPEYTPNFMQEASGERPANPAEPAQQPAPGAGPEVRELSQGSALDRLRDRAAQNVARDTYGSRATDFEQELPPYTRLEQSRRVRSGELHYIDHPEIGVLVRVNPVAAPKLLQEQFTLLQ